jgi:hypothetical protein
MNRFLTGCLALLIACGGQEAGAPAASPPGTTTTPTGPTGKTAPVPTARIDARATTAKIVVKTTTSSEVAVGAYDGATDSTVAVTCTQPAGTECAALQATDPGVHCSAIPGTGNVCAVTRVDTTIFYVQNSSPPAATFPVPCDGKAYAVEAYGGAPAPIGLLDAWSAPAVVADADCNVTTSPAWGDPVTRPTIGFPEIYVGLPAPLDTYTVRVQDVRYPWSTQYTMTCGGQAATRTTLAGARFPAPATADPLACTATFVLDGSLRAATEDVAPWQLAVQGTAQPVPFTGVPTP